MNKTWEKGMLFAMSLLLGIILMTQYQTSNSVLGNEKNPSEISAELDDEMEALNKEKNDLRDELDKVRKQAAESEELSKKREAEIEKIMAELEKQKIMSGHYDVKGPGAVITIGESPDSYVNLAYSHQYILALISYLNNAGAEAISINGQRYTNYTEIVPVLDHININGVAFVLPLEIKAIGSTRTIEASLNFVGGIVTQMTEIGFTVEAEYLNEIQINRYEGEKTFTYATPVDTKPEE